jgi:DTW domain-containing protein
MARSVCYCAYVKPFEAGPLLVVLVHPKETRKRIGTNRMVQLGVSNSLRFMGTGEQLDVDPRIESLLRNPKYYPMVLYPGSAAIDLDSDSQGRAPLTEALRAGKRLLIFVIDGTWDLAQQMLHRSPRLQALPQLMFRPETPSSYRIRRQPGKICLSTVEAVHALLDRLDRLGTYPLPARGHDGLLEVFDQMVERQIRCQNIAKAGKRG